MIVTRAMAEPRYLEHQTTAGYQLNWSYSLFWRETPKSLGWLADLQAATEYDSIRVLNHRFEPPHVSQFLISTTPDVAPVLIAQRVKGRLQHLIRGTSAQAFRRNYALRSIGSTKRDKVEAYLASQLGHHQFADPRFEERLAKYQIADATIDLSSPRETAHARYWYNLHVVFVMRDREWHVHDEFLTTIHNMIRGAATKKWHMLSRAGILPDHIHLAIGCALDESPAGIAISYMNNLAHAVRSTVFGQSYWVGTFGEYDLGAVAPRSPVES
jgi:REP element-mobilizing transposase RayT